MSSNGIARHVQTGNDRRFRMSLQNTIAVPAGRFVKGVTAAEAGYSSTDPDEFVRLVLPANSPMDRVIGIGTSPYPASRDGDITVRVGGTCLVEAGAAIATKQLLSCDSVGRAIPHVVGAQISAVALGSATAAGDYLECALLPSGMAIVDGHLFVSGPAMPKTAFSDSGLAVTQVGSDSAGTFTLATGTGTQSGLVFAMNYTKAYPTAPSIILVAPLTSQAASIPVYASSTTTRLSITAAGTYSAAFQIAFSYLILQ